MSIINLEQHTQNVSNCIYQIALEWEKIKVVGKPNLKKRKKIAKKNAKEFNLQFKLVDAILWYHLPASVIIIDYER